MVMAGAVLPLVVLGDVTISPICLFFVTPPRVINCNHLEGPTSFSKPLDLLTIDRTKLFLMGIL